MTRVRDVEKGGSGQKITEIEIILYAVNSREILKTNVDTNPKFTKKISKLKIHTANFNCNADCISFNNDCKMDTLL